MKLIDKAAILAEIDRQKIGYNTDGKHSVEYDITKKIIDIINTLEVKEVDLDFTKEVDVWVRDNGDTNGFFNVQDLAKHFFELGIKSKGK